MEQLLTEYTPLQYDRNIISEAMTSGGPIILKNVVLQRANQRNQNGRIYGRDILEREVLKYNKEFVSQRRGVGELDHSETSVVNLKNVSHLVIRVDWRGDDVVGDIEILTTPSGNIARELIKNNVKVGISSRGLGEVKEVGDGTVKVTDYSLVSWDLVSTPSTFGAFINESADPRILSANRLDKLVYEFLSQIN